MSHSLTGASSAERWMNCSGYLALAQGMSHNPNRLDPDYTREGNAAHTVAAWCLKEDRDAWEFAGEIMEGVRISEGEGQVSPTAIQLYIDECRRILALDPMNTEFWIETAVGADEGTRPHPGFYGTLDFGAIIDADPFPVVLIRDLKMGEGVYVEVEENEQLLYYAYGLLHKLMTERGAGLDECCPVNIGIVQPRYWGYDGPRTWETTVGYVLQWGASLVEKMHEATRKVESGNVEFVPGEWCRFCPVKLRCPALRGMFAVAVKSAMLLGENSAKGMKDPELGREYSLVPMAEMYMKAVKGEVDYRAQNGRTDQHWKLAKKKVDRQWRDGAYLAVRDTLGGLAMTAPALKSPAQVEKISDSARRLVAQWAFSPDGGLVVVHPDDRRPAEKAVSPATVFADFEGR